MVAISKDDVASGDATCPYCGEPMQPGVVLGDRYALKWQPAEEPLLLGLWSTGHCIGTGGALLSRARASGWRCATCEKIIVDG